MQEIFEKIITTFETNLFSLAPKYQYHWATRRYRATGDEKYIQPIWMDFHVRTLAVLPRIKNTNFFNSPARIGRQMLANYSSSSEKKKARYDYYIKHPEVVYYFNLVHYLFMVKSYGMHNLVELKPYYKRGKVILSKVDWEKVFLAHDLISANPSNVANSIYYLKYLGVSNLEQRLLTTYKDHWINFEPKNAIDWQNKVYALTHVIIAASYFYQKKVEAKKVDWILKFFEDNIDEIIKNTNSDITAEVGLCFKLVNDRKNPVIEKVQRFLLSRFDDNLGVIPREDGLTNLEKLEHRNVVASLVLGHLRKLHPGPDLYTYMTTSKKSFYIPQSGKYVGVVDQIED